MQQHQQALLSLNCIQLRDRAGVLCARLDAAPRFDGGQSPRFYTLHMFLNMMMMMVWW